MDALESQPRSPSRRLAAWVMPLLIGVFSATLASAQSTPRPDAMRPLGLYQPGLNGVRYDSASQAVLFLFRDRPFARIRLHAQATLGGVLEIEDLVFGGRAVEGAGLLYRTANGSLIGPRELAERNPTGRPLMSWTIRGSTLELQYWDRLEGVSSSRSYAVTAIGAGLEIELRSTSSRLTARNNYAGSILPALSGLERSHSLSIPYLQHVPIVVAESSALPKRMYFTTRLFDPARSSASRLEVFEPETGVGKGGSRFQTEIEPLDDGTISEPARDIVYWISDQIPWTAFPVYSRPPSPYLSELKARANADTFVLFNFLANHFGTHLGNADNPFDAGRVFLWGLREFGVDALTVLYQTGWREHLDPSLPRHCSEGPDPRICYPSARPEDVAALRAFVGDVTGHGARLALGINLMHVAPDSPEVPWSALSRASNGAPRVQVMESGQSFFLIRPDRQRDIIWRPGQPDPGTLWRLRFSYPSLNAAFCDAWGKHVPNRSTTRESAAPAARTLRSAIEETKNTMLFVRDKIGGPVFAEGVGTRDVYDYSGFIDGYEREIHLDRESPIIPDFEQLVVNRYAAHHGVGYLNRFYGNHPWESIDVDQVDFHEVRAFTLAFGHVTQLLATGIVHDPVKTPLSWWTYHVVNEYYATHALQRLATDVVRLILYRDPQTGDQVLLHKALRRGLDFRRSQITLEFYNGLRLCLNFSDQPWEVDTGTGRGPSGGRFTLPRFGYVAWRSGTPATEFLAFSALIQGRRADYVGSSEYRMLNGFGSPLAFEGLSTRWLSVERSAFSLYGDPSQGVLRY